MISASAMGIYNLRDAEKYARIYLDESPGEINMQYILGRIYYINGDDRAFEYLSKVMKSKSFEGLLSSGLYYELTKDDSKAENILNAVIKYREDLISPYIALSRIKQRSKNREEAYKALLTAGTAAF